MLLFILVNFMLNLCVSINAHGFLINPPARSSAWRERPDIFVSYYNDNQMNCGGFSNQWVLMGGKCGICGENWSVVKKFEKGGSLYRGISLRTYKQGQLIDVNVELTANHEGIFEFRLCNIDNQQNDATQECLDSTLLMSVDGLYRIPISSQISHFHTKLYLPNYLTCNNCVFQWKYITGNSWGINYATGQRCVGCGPQEQFYGCADVTILP